MDDYSCKDDGLGNKHPNSCSPFCGHFCCGITINIVEIAQLEFQRIPPPEEEIFYYQQSILSNFFHAVWHPPKA